MAEDNLEEDSGEGKPAENASPESGNKKKFLLLSLAAFLLVVVVGTASYFLFLKPQPQAIVSSEPQIQIVEIDDPDQVLSGAVLRLEPFVVNLKENSGILNLTVAFEFYDFNIPEDMDARMPGLRDLVITTASTFHANDLLYNGAEKVKEALIEEINKRVSERNPITKVYVEHLLIR